MHKADSGALFGAGPGESVDAVRSGTVDVWY
jgi:hypothetical protein